MSSTSHQKEHHCFLNISCNSHDLPFWQIMEPSTPVMLYDVDSTSEESKKLVSMFHETLHVPEFQIQRILRVQNPVLWLHYVLKQQEMTQKHSQVYKSHGLWLFHGTHRCNLESIVKQGFDWRRQKTHGKMLGNGTYFASKASDAHEFTDCGGNNISVRRQSKNEQSSKLSETTTQTKTQTTFSKPTIKRPQFLNQPFLTNADFLRRQMIDSLTRSQQPYQNSTADIWSLFNRQAQCDSHFIIISRVLVGLYTVGKEGLHLPPTLPHNNLYLRYDSCVDNVDNPKSFVIFDHNQAYPEYIIEYQHSLSS